ncbi:MAG: histidine kinase [Bacteroidales bacterium]|nr:histidine kinase [Bacteroidales bacterium]
MFNPIALNRKYLITYFVVWGALALTHIILLVNFYDFNVGILITEGLLFNFLFSVIGLGLWFPIYFSKDKQKNFIGFFGYHIASCALSIGLWLWISYSILSLAFSNNALYLEHLNQTLLLRIGSGLFFYILIVLIYYLIIYYNNFKEKLVKESELRSLVKESELKSLKSQINPHFLFNSLNSISSLTLISPEKAQEMVIKLSEFLRYSLSNSNEQLTTLEKEVENITRYLDIEKIRFGKRLVVELETTEDCNRQLLPGLILQPLIENSIKYGVYESTELSTINIHCKCNNTALFIRIVNDYDPEAIIKKGEGIGISNIKKRLKLVYNRDDLISFNKQKNSFEVNIQFPQLID